VLVTREPQEGRAEVTDGFHLISAIFADAALRKFLDEFAFEAEDLKNSFISVESWSLQLETTQSAQSHLTSIDAVLLIDRFAWVARDTVDNRHLVISKSVSQDEVVLSVNSNFELRKLLNYYKFSDEKKSLAT
jgi:hypothetical protein